MRRRTPLPWLAGLLAAYLAAPFAAGLAHARLAQWGTADWTSLGWASAVSLASATVATALVTLCGVPLGYLLARVRGRPMALLGFLVQLPLALPPLASGILLLFLIGYASPLGRATGGALTDSFVGVVLAETFVAAPFLIIAARSAFAAIDPALEDVAATLGHRPWAVFCRASLPLAWRAILAGMLLAWLRAFGEFGATVMVAYHPYSLPVYTYVAFGSQGLPAMLPVLLPTLATAVVVMALAATFAGGRRVRRHPVPAEVVLPYPVPAAAVAGSGVARVRRRQPSISMGIRRRLDGFDIDVAWQSTARRLAILGASGSGKSLTLRAIAGLDRAGSGTLVLDGRELWHLAPEDRGIAYVPQAYGLLPHLTVARQLRFAVGADARLGEYWTHRFGLAGLAERRPDALSLGQQQRVALARALSRPARLLLLDEPFAALDTGLRRELARALRALQDDIDATTILVTHDPEEAFLLADDLLVLGAGRVLQSGPAEQVFLRPASEAVARLLGAQAVGHGVAVATDRIDVGAGVRLGVAGPALVPGTRLGWTVRPDRVRIGVEGYPAEVVGLGPATPMQREIVLQLGATTLCAAVAPGEMVAAGACRVFVHPSAVQVWTL